MSWKNKPGDKTDDFTDRITRGVKNFLGINTPMNKQSKITIPRCFGEYRSPQSDAENCCKDCAKNEVCFRKFKAEQEKLTKQAKEKPKWSDVYSVETPPKLEPKPSTPPIVPKTDTQLKPKLKTLPVTHPDHEKEFLKIFKQLTYRHRAWDAWKDFIVMFACALSNPVDKSHYDEREALYLKTINGYSKQEQVLFPELVAATVMALEGNLEQDFLGRIFMNLDLGNDSGGQFFTPYNVCELMAAIVTDEVIPRVEKKGYITINDPCCGAGATLIAGVHAARKQLEKVKLNFQEHVLVYAQDIDYTTALMCYIQLSLLGVAACIKIGNSLTEPMCSNDTQENYWFTPMYFSGIWTARRIFRGGTLL